MVVVVTLVVTVDVVVWPGDDVSGMARGLRAHAASSEAPASDDRSGVRRRAVSRMGGGSV